MKLLLPIVFLLPGAALAHSNHMGEGALIAGISHPLSGLDHILAMLAVGLWAALLSGRAIWALPLSFVAAMIIGGLVGAVGLTIPGVEPGILASVLGIGAAISLAVRLPTPQAAALVAVFGVFHGHAHGIEGASYAILPYALGFTLSSMMLHGLGLVMGRALQATTLRLLGGLTFVSGLLITIGG